MRSRPYSSHTEHMPRIRPAVVGGALGVGALLVLGAVAVGAAASTGRFSVGTAAIVLLYILWPALLFLVFVLLMVAFTLFAAAFFQRIHHTTRDRPTHE